MSVKASPKPVMRMSMKMIFMMMRTPNMEPQLA